MQNSDIDELMHLIIWAINNLVHKTDDPAFLHNLVVDYGFLNEIGEFITNGISSDSFSFHLDFKLV